MIDRCLAKDPAERYVSTLDLARELRSLREHLPEVASSGSSWRPGLRALTLRPDSDAILRKLADLLVDDGRTEEALDAARRAVALRPAFGLYQKSVGWVLFRTGRFREAAKASVGRPSYSRTTPPSSIALTQAEVQRVREVTVTLTGKGDSCLAEAKPTRVCVQPGRIKYDVQGQEIETLDPDIEVRN